MEPATERRQDYQREILLLRFSQLPAGVLGGLLLSYGLLPLLAEPYGGPYAGFVVGLVGLMLVWSAAVVGSRPVIASLLMGALQLGLGIQLVLHLAENSQPFWHGAGVRHRTYLFLFLLGFWNVTGGALALVRIPRRVLVFARGLEIDDSVVAPFRASGPTLGAASAGVLLGLLGESIRHMHVIYG